MATEANGDGDVALGFTGVGGRGAHLLEMCLEMDEVAVPAVCDTQERHRERAGDDVSETGRPEPERYADHERMAEDTDLDGVVIATPWEYHIPMAVTAMEAGVDVGLEVGPASSVEECWDLVRTAERTGSHCMLLENCCYYRDCMAVLNMVREGVFGDLVHCECGYHHDLRERIVTGSGRDVDRGGGRDFRGVHNEKRNGDIYPTHGVGPMAKCLEVNRGNRFVTLTATASKEAGLSDWAEENLDADHPSRDVDWSIGDVVTTVLKCANGETLVVTHDVSLPRPYSNGYVVQGTDGIWQRETETVHVEGESPEHEWEAFEDYQTEYEHPRWEEYREEGVHGGHGGIDTLVLRDFVDSVGRGARPPIDVYDAATWMAIGPLSERSVARGGAAVDVPDFTSGGWLQDDPTFGLVE
ncbi:MAG: Gfo/Idh/MocA family protein [Halobacteriaceae archaeon]